MDDDFFMQKKIEVMLDINNKKIANEINNINNMINKLNNEISELKRNINERTPKLTTMASSVKAEEVKTTIASQAKNNESLRPRYGDYKPEDVSIGKFFYFGNKR